jgi:hypothetical protein
MSMIVDDRSSNDRDHIYLPPHQFPVIVVVHAKDKVSLSIHPAGIKTGYIILLGSFAEYQRTWTLGNVSRIGLHLQLQKGSFPGQYNGSGQPGRHGDTTERYPPIVDTPDHANSTPRLKSRHCLENGAV